MSRTIKSVKRPDEHLFNPDDSLGTDHKGRRFCRCQLREDDSVHITSEQFAESLPETPAEDETSRILGEGGDAA